ncbi:MAG: TetR/AcrR family transcriptional regulator [Bacilli bacterium]|nr:TetR/AcrR family transcriptional regulator [Bacilli bacterium]
MKTGHALAITLKDMMAKQPLETISVLELSKRCGVSRKTFYYHYHDTYDLLTQVFLEEKIAGVNSASNFIELVGLVFQYYKDNQAFVDATLQSAGSDLFSEFVYNIFYTAALRFIKKIDEENILHPNTKKSIARFYAYGYGNSTVYYLSNYKNKTLIGLMNSFSFIDKENFKKNVQKAINLEKK